MRRRLSYIATVSLRPIECACDGEACLLDRPLCGSIRDRHGLPVALADRALATLSWCRACSSSRRLRSRRRGSTGSTRPSPARSSRPCRTQRSARRQSSSSSRRIRCAGGPRCRAETSGYLVPRGQPVRQARRLLLLADPLQRQTLGRVRSCSCRATDRGRIQSAAIGSLARGDKIMLVGSLLSLGDRHEAELPSIWADRMVNLGGASSMRVTCADTPRSPEDRERGGLELTGQGHDQEAQEGAGAVRVGRHARRDRSRRRRRDGRLGVEQGQRQGPGQDHQVRAQATF